MKIQMLKEKYHRCNESIEVNNQKLHELDKTKKIIEMQIQKLEDKNTLLRTEKITTGLEICKIEGHISNWHDSYIEGASAVCVCERCNGIAKIKL